MVIFRIENQTNIKETMSILTVHDSIGFPQTVGGILIKGGILNRQIMGGVICITLHLYVCLSVWSDQTKSRKELSHAVKK